jgi:hypothetical protein
MSSSFEIILGLVAGALVLTSMSSRGSKKESYKPMKRTNPLTENNFSFKPQYDDDDKKKSKKK